MTSSSQLRQTAGLMLATLSLVEFAAVAWVLAFGPFDTALGPIPILARNASKPFLVAVVIGCIAVWLLESRPAAATPSGVGTVCRRAAGAAVILSIVPLVAPFFLPDFVVGHDGGVHQTYAFFMDRALRQGQVPVRWVEGIANGLGQPLFNYYQVGFYYLVALIHWCGPSLSLALKLAVAILWASGSTFMFLWCRPLGVLPAALAAAVFAWSPYMLLDAYVRTAFPEFSAIAFAPGVLWSIDRLLRTGRPIFVCTLALTTGLLLASHLPTAVMVAPLSAAYLLGSWIVHRHQLKLIGLAAVGAAFGAALAAFYVVPAITELHAVKATRLTSAYFDYHQHFVRPEWWVNWSWGYGGSGEGAVDQLSVQIGIVQWIVLAAAVILIAVAPIRRRTGRQAIAVSGWVAVAAVSLFMMTAASAGVWDRIGALAFIQFPWRFLVLPTLACGVLAGTVLSTIRHPTSQALIVLVVVTLQWYVTRDYREMAWTRERAQISIDDPAWPSTDNARRWAFRESGYDPVSVTHEEPLPSPAGRWTVAEGQAEVWSTSEADARLRLTVRAQNQARLVINSPFFAGWQVLLDGRDVPPAIQAVTGYMEVTVPAGTHRVEAVLGRTRVRAAAEMITLTSAAIWLALVCGIASGRRGVRSIHA